MRRVPTTILLLILAASTWLAPDARGNATYQPLPFTQDWSNTSLLNGANDWSAVPGILGFSGQGMGVSVGTDPQLVLASAIGTPQLIPNLSNPIVAPTEGVAEFQIADPVVALAGGGNSGGGGGGGGGPASFPAPHLVLHLNASNRHTIVVSYRLRDLEGAGGTDNALQQVALQYRIGSTASWTNVPQGFVADATNGPGLLKETLVSATLPAAANFANQLQVRILTVNAPGEDEWVGVDDLSVTGSTASFQDITPAELAGGGAFRSAAWGLPVGAPGTSRQPALFVSSSTLRNRVLRLDTGGGWQSDSSSAYPGGGGGAAWVSVGEAPNQCVFFSNATGGLWRGCTANGASYLWTRVLDLPFVVARQAWADFDRDGNLDVLLGGWSPGSFQLYRGGFDGGFALASSPGLPLGGTVNGIEWGDFDGDGDHDMLVVKHDQSSVIGRNLGGGAFDSVGFGSVATDLGAGGSWADFDDDGDLDVLLTRDQAGCRLLRNDGGGWTDVTPSPLADSAAWRGAGWADYDLDGDLDVYVVREGGSDVLLRNEGPGWTDVTPLEPALSGSADGVSVTWADLEGDGVPELYVTRLGVPATLFRNTAAKTNHHLRVLPAAWHQNRTGTGAKVRIVVGGSSRTRVIPGGGGHASQSEPVAAFGLGAATAVDSVVVEFPSGAVALATNVTPVDRTISLRERSQYFVATPSITTTGTRGASWRSRTADTYDEPNLILDQAQFYYHSVDAGLVREQHYNEFLPKGHCLWGHVEGTAGDTWGLLAMQGTQAEPSIPAIWQVWSEGTHAPYLADSSNVPWGSAASVLSTASWVDIDQDGDLDAHLLDRYGAGKVIRRVNGGWVESTPFALADADSAGHAAWADFDGDRDPDVLLVGSGKPHRLLRNDGVAWTDVTPPDMAGAPVATDGWDASFADCDDDGDLDLLVFDSNGAHRFRRTGASWSAWPDPALDALGNTCAGATWADLDLDGDLDLVAGGMANGSARVLFNQGDGSFVDDTRIPFTRPFEPAGAPAVADVDRDGDPDFVLSGFGTARAYRNDTHSTVPGVGNNWFHLGLAGVESNRDGIGARIELVAGGRKQTRIVTGDMDLFSQSAYPVIFGLGQAAIIDSLRISWPSGTTFDTTGVAVRQRVVWHERERLLVADVADRSPAGLDLSLLGSNPFVERMALGFTLAGRCEVSLTIHDVQGRVVRTLARGVRDAGQHHASWNGRAEDGSRARPGVYWARLAARDARGEQVRTRKAVLTR